MSIPLPNLPHWAFADKHDLVPSEVRTDIKRYGESYAAAVSAADNAALRKENFALAAGQCVSATADDGGRLYCKEVIALRERVRVLEDALRGVLPWVVTQEVACNGLKCREDVCMSCNSDSAEAAEKACDAYGIARAALGDKT